MAQGFAAISTSTGAQASQTGVNTLRLPYGVEDILKLSKAGINDQVIVKYIGNKGTVYNLSSETIVHLKDEGVSDTVLNAMLDQPKATTGATSTWISQAPAQTPQQQQAAPVYTQPPPADPPAPPPPPPAPRSTLHIIPYYPATYSYYGPSWSGYYSPYVGPRISLGFGFGLGHLHGHHHHRLGCW
jgi:hypothetical protein